MTAVRKTAEQLIDECQNLVRSLAWKIRRTLPDQVDIDDLIAYGQIGLAEAAKNFDPDRGLEFSTYAYYRIRGAIYDGVSKMSWLSRAHYHRLRYEQLADEVLRLQGLEDVSDSDDLEVEAAWFQQLTSSLAVVYLTTHCDEDAQTADVEDESAPAPASEAISKETSQILHRLIDALPDQAGILVRAVYFEGLTLKEAGERIGVSKAWASRLHARTLEQLARSLQKLEQPADLPEPPPGGRA